MNNSQQYHERILAFVDILGFKELIRSSENDTTKLNAILNALSFLKSLEMPKNWTSEDLEIEECVQYKGIDRFKLQDSIRCTTFSDSIAVSVNVQENVNEAVSFLIVNLALVGYVLLQEGILLRGGITIGKLLHTDDGVVMGQGLIDAYELETTHAKYPRIILSKKLLQVLEYPIVSKSQSYPYHQYFERFDDGCVGFHQMKFLQVIQSATKYKGQSIKNSLNIIRKRIIHGLDENLDRPEVYAKYKWLKDAYNNLIILEEAKGHLYDLNEGIREGNIHFSYTDDFYTAREKNGTFKNDIKSKLDHPSE